MDDVAVEIATLKQRQTVSEHRISDLEGEVKDIRQLTTAVVQVNDKVDGINSALTDFKGDVAKDMGEIKDDVKGITSRPSKLWDNIASAFIGAVAAGIAAAVLALILK